LTAWNFGRPKDEHGNVGLGRRANPLEDDEHLLVAANHFAESLDRRRLVLGADGGAAFEEVIEQLGDRLVGRPVRHEARRRAAGHHRGHTEVHQLADTVLDVELQPSERLHQRFDVERFFGPRAQIAKQAGPERRLNQRPEPHVEVARFSGFRGGGGAGAARAEGEVVH
jgi:hypothetical protein